MSDLSDLDLGVVSITQDADGIISINHDGMDEQRALWMLESARFLLLSWYWLQESDDEDEE